MISGNWAQVTTVPGYSQRTGLLIFLSAPQEQLDQQSFVDLTCGHEHEQEEGGCGSHLLKAERNLFGTCATAAAPNKLEENKNKQNRRTNKLKLDIAEVT